MADSDCVDMEQDIEIIQEVPAPAKKPADNVKLASAKKDEGNILYKQQKYTEAIQRYTEAIELCPECAAYYGNRAACHIMQNRYSQALQDAQQAVRLDRSSVKSHLREARCHLALGDLASARRSLLSCRELEPENASLLQEQKNLESLQYFICEGEKSYEKEDYRKVVYCMDRALLIAISSNHFKLLKAECLALLSRYQEAQEIANDVLQFDNSNVDALYVRGMCLYYRDNVERALTHFQHLLKLAPDHSKARELYRKAKQLKLKKEEGNQAFKSGKLQVAYDCYTQALEIDQHNIFTNAKLYFNRATVCSKINKVNQAIQDCTKAIELDENYIKAYLRRAKSYMEQEMFDESVRDYETVYRKEKTKEHKRLLEQAKLELKKSKRKDYYKILGINKNASDDEIKKAYKKQALLHHPDRHSNATDEKKIEHEKKFKDLSEAYSILSDTKKRTRYDSGLDINEDSFTDIDPNNIFQTFFHGGPGMFSSRQDGFNFPNGTSFSFQFG